MNVIATEKAPAAIGPYSQGCEINGLVFTSGQIPIVPETGAAPEGIEAQAGQSCRNVGAVLAALVLVGAAFLARKAQQDEGKLWGLRVCSLECDYRILYAALGAAFVCVLLGLALPAISYYLMWALGILLFAELVYHTTKLM